MFTTKQVAKFISDLDRADTMRNSTKLFAFKWRFAMEGSEWKTLDELVEAQRVKERTILRYISEIRSAGVLAERWHPEKNCKIYSLSSI